MSEEGVKACVDCKHFKGSENLYQAQMTQQRNDPECGHPQARSRDPIYGKALCHNERNNNKGCGKKGKLWDSKKTEKKT